jgi:hypothetical protein
VIEELPSDASRHRRVVLADLDRHWSWPFDLSVEWFIAFIAADATNVANSSIRLLAQEMLRHRCAYVCAWGPGCGRVHAVMDQVYLEFPSHKWRGSEIVQWSSEIPYLMTTWHDDESLASGLWYAHECAFPDEDGYYEETPTTFVALSGGEYRADVRSLLMDPDRLDRESDDLIT